MDITLNPVSGASQPYTPAIPKVRTTDTVPAYTSPTETAPQLSVGAVSSIPPSTESQNEAAAREAALSFKNVYAVSDQDFTIFKDASGKFITRYVSLRDGKVTYVPTPTLVKQLPVSTAPRSLAISA